MAKRDCYEILGWIETMAATKRAYRSLGYEVVCRIPDFYAPSDDKLILVNKVHGIYNCTVACFVTLLHFLAVCSTLNKRAYCYLSESLTCVMSTGLAFCQHFANKLFSTP